MDNPLGNKDLSNKTLAGTYKLIRRLGMGAFGEIYLAVNKQKEEFAIKLERGDTKYPQILYEFKVYNFLHADQALDKGFPKVFAASSEGDYNYLVMELLGQSLEDLFIFCKQRFSLKTVLMLAEQMVSRIEAMHARSFIHRDIKPDNFLMGLGKKASKVFIVDMGLAKRYLTKDGHIPYRENKALTGTARYASLNTHLGFEQSRRDDLEGLAYVLVYLAKGSLPWMNLKSYNQNDKYEKIKDKKMQTTSAELCRGLPQEMAQYVTYVKALKFEEKPDYEYARQLFRTALQKANYQNDQVYDWTKPEQKAAEAGLKVKQEAPKDAPKEAPPEPKAEAKREGAKQQVPREVKPKAAVEREKDPKLQTQELKREAVGAKVQGGQAGKGVQVRVQSAQRPAEKKKAAVAPPRQSVHQNLQKVSAPRIVINKEPYTKY